MTKFMAILEMALSLLTRWLQARDKAQQEARYEEIKDDPKADFRRQFGDPQRLPDDPSTDVHSASGTTSEMGGPSKGNPDP